MSGKSAPNDTVKDIMTSPVKTVLPQTPIEDAIVILTGIISQSDVLIGMLADKAAT